MKGGSPGVCGPPAAPIGERPRAGILWARTRRTALGPAAGARPLKERPITPEITADDAETSLRPRRLGEFIGQANLRANLGVFIEAARGRAEALDHVLFAGPPGLARRRWRRSSPTNSGWASG